MRHVRSAVLGILLLGLLTACTSPAPAPSAVGSDPPSAGSSTPATAGPSTTGSGAPPSTAPTTATATPIASTGSSTDPNRPSGQCADSALRLELSMPKGAAGSFVQDISFINEGSSPCVLRGAPGLSVVGDGNGTQLGAPATRDQSDAKTVRLAAHGGSVYAPFTGPELESGTEGAKQCSGGVEKADGYRVYPPHSTLAFFLKDADALACPTGGAFLRVGVVRPTGTP